MERTARQQQAIANDHPHQCTACGSCYTTSRYAARCCGTAAQDLRTGVVTDYSEEAELAYQAADAAQWAAEDLEYHYECSCGERYRTIDAATCCRKCRTYAPKGYCTTVWDTHTDAVVWTR
jgi:hypothetical protein